MLTPFSKVNSWFEERWLAADDIDSALLDNIRPLWKQNRGRRSKIGPRPKTILSTLDRDPDWFRNLPIRLAGYEYTTESSQARKTYAALKSKYYSKREQERYDRLDISPYYESKWTWEMHPGEYIIDYDVRKSGKSVCSGIWRVRDERWFVPLGRLGKRRLMWLDLVEKAFDLRFPVNEQKELGRRLSNYFKKKGKKPDRNDCFIDIPLYELPKLLSRINETNSLGSTVLTEGVPANISARSNWTQTEAFKYFGTNRSNPRWSWSALSVDRKTAVLTLWLDEFKIKDNSIIYEAKKRSSRRNWTTTHGNRERVKNLKWVRDHCDGIFRVVIAIAKDKTASIRRIKVCFPAPNLIMRITYLNELTGEFRSVHIG